MKRIEIINRILFLGIFIFISSFTYGKLEDGKQPEQQDNSEKEVSPAKIPAKMSLRYFKKSDGTETVKVSVWYKEGKKNIPVQKAIVNLYLNEVSREGMMTNLFTDENGEGVFLLTDRFYKRAEGKYEYLFIGRMMDEELYEPTEEEITVKRAEIKLVVSDKDSSITAILYQIAGKDSLIPVPDAEIKIGIKRSFSMLPIGDPLTTDQNGSAAAVCPSDIPGDSLGQIIIVAKIEDNDDFGSFESEQIVNWGIPVKNTISERRSLWASGRNAPISLVTASIIIVVGIWGFLFYLMFQLIRIKKLGNPKK